MSRKIRPNVFLKAARFLERELEANEAYSRSTCCDVLSGLVPEDEFNFTPEYEFFKKMFSNKRSCWQYWFGNPEKCNNHDGYYFPHPINQKKRIKALYKAYNAAKRLNRKK
jgi:hypothetical protein